MTPKLKKILIGTGLVLLLGVLTFMAVRRGGGETVEVRAEVVGARDLVSRVTATGHVEARRSVDISADISGRVVELPVEEGDEVEEGDLLLVIDPTQYRAAVRRAEAALAEARAREARARSSFEQARRQFERTRKLKERGQDYITDQELETARTEVEVAEAELEAANHSVAQAEAALEEAEDRLAKTVIHAPMTGRVTRLDVEQGETAVVGTMNNPGSLLLTVSDLAEMEAVLEVDETDVTAVSAGDSATVEIDAFPDRAFAGRVRKIGNSSVRGRGQPQAGGDEAVDFEVRIDLADPPVGIRPDLSATGDIITAVRRDVLAIPIIGLTLRTADQLGIRPDSAAALRPDGAAAGRGVEGVFVVGADSVRFQPVRVGIAGQSYFEVLEGLNAGDTVVAGPYRAIRDLEPGSRVEITELTGEGSDGPGGGDSGDGASEGADEAPDGAAGGGGA